MLEIHNTNKKSNSQESVRNSRPWENEKNEIMCCLHLKSLRVKWLNVLKEGFDVDLLKDIKVDAVFLDLP